MRHSIIDELLRESSSREEKCFPKNPDYRLHCKKACDLENVLTSQLKENQRSIFLEYVNEKLIEVGMEIEEAFRQGVSLGVRFTAEAFLLGEEQNG